MLTKSSSMYMSCVVYKFEIFLFLAPTPCLVILGLEICMQGANRRHVTSDPLLLSLHPICPWPSRVYNAISTSAMLHAMNQPSACPSKAKLASLLA